MAVKITVEFAGQLASELGRSKVLEVEKGATLKSIIEQVERIGGHTFLVSVDNEQVVDYNRVVDENSEILLLSPMSGG